MSLGLPPGVLGASLPTGRTPWTSDVQTIGVRLGPDSNLVPELSSILEDSPHSGVAIVSAAGSLADVTYALATVTTTGRTSYSAARRSTGAIELLALSGHVGRLAGGDCACHLHVVLAEEDGVVIGGHLFQARVLATVELTLIAAPGVGWRAHPVRHDGFAYATHVLSPSTGDGA